MSEPYLHIYAQEQWHGNDYVVGNKEALERLRDALNDALEKGQGQATTYVNDGEGYYALVVQSDDETIDKLMVPYIDEIAYDSRDDIVHPWELDGAKAAEREAQQNSGWGKKHISLTIKALDKDTEINICDDEGHLVESGVGQIDTALLPGEYGVAFGSERAVEMFELEAPFTFEQQPWDDSDWEEYEVKNINEEPITLKTFMCLPKSRFLR
jgi:hypothetical protein